jgi:RNA polymerase sigma-70 factor (ECF subfamily)
MAAAGNIALGENRSLEKQRDQELVFRILNGERKLFHELVRPYERAVYFAAQAVLRNHADAEEAAQETMIRAFTHLGQLNDATKFKSWLLQIAVNEARRKRRDAHGNIFEALELDNSTDPDPMPRDFADWRENPEEALQRVEVRKLVAQAVSELPDKYREIFVLRDVQQLSVQECVHALQVSEEVIKVRLHRARLMIREKLAPVFKKSWLARVFPGKGQKPW